VPASTTGWPWPADAPAIAAPAHLSQPARELFAEVVALLELHHLVERADALAVENFVGATLRLRAIQAHLDADGLLDDSGDVSPLVNAAATASRVVAALAEKLGLGRVARARAASAIVASEPKPLAPASPNDSRAGDALVELLRDVPRVTAIN
jgi:P27 family predicted phage terminase small subunit